jgi:transposase
LVTNSKRISELYIQVESCKREQNRCPIWGKKLSVYDKKKSYRKWRSLKLGTIPVYGLANTNRVSCSEHGVITAGVPWARQSSGFTKDFENQVAWLLLI